MHYNNLTDAQETANIFESKPTICKLADLGEARSKLLQTRVVSNNSRIQLVRVVVQLTWLQKFWLRSQF